jgi:hypothetical protein
MTTPPGRPSRRAAIAVVALLLASASPWAAAAGGDARGDGLGDGPGDGPAPAWGVDNYAGTYVIVAPRDWRESLEPLMEWRASADRVIPRFLALEDAYANGTGRDAAARLKDAIARFADAYTGLETLLLVGDGGVIPVRWVFTDIMGSGNVSDPRNLRWTDDYYVYGDEDTWDRDGDGVYGEDGEVLKDLPMWTRDELPNRAAVGRIPAQNAIQVERYVDKLLAYERSPPDGDWLERALLVSGLMDVPNVIDNPLTPDVDGGYDPNSDNAYESHTLLQEQLPEGLDVTWLYDYPYVDGGHWNRSIDMLDHDRLVAAFDRGNSIVSFNTHGYVDGSGLSDYNGSGYSNYDWDWDTLYDYNDADRAANGGRLPFVFIAACYVGDVSSPGARTLARLVLNPTGGAVAMVAGNGENYKGEFWTNRSLGNWYIERTFWRNYYEDAATYGPGLALADTRGAYLGMVASSDVPHGPVLDAHYAADYLSYNLLGDPLTRVWMSSPERMRVSAIEDDWLLWRTSREDGIIVSVVDESGVPPDDVRGHVQWTGGEAGFTLFGNRLRFRVPLDAGPLHIRLFARGFIPLELDVDRPVVERDMVVADVWWSVDGVRTEAWPDAGSTVDLSARIAFQGRYDYDQVRVQFLVSREGGPFEPLTPETWAPVDGFTEATIIRPWQPPPQPGLWRLRVVVNPDGKFPDADPANSAREVALGVRGAPSWAGLPDPLAVDVRASTVGSVDLAPFLTDPDTPLGDLRVTASATGGAEGLVDLGVDGSHRLWVRPHPEAPCAFDLALVVSDGGSDVTVTVPVILLRARPDVRLVVPGPLQLRVGGTASGAVAVEPVVGCAIDGITLIAEAAPTGFTLDTRTGAFSFTPEAAGVYWVTVVATWDNGTPVPVASAELEFRVAGAVDRPPAPVAWPDITVAAGSEGVFRLRAEDPEGSDITYALGQPGTLEATLGPSGLLVLSPAKGDTGEHTLMIVLSDGTNNVTVPLVVSVTDAPGGGGSGHGPYIVLGVVAFLVAAFAWRARMHARALERGPGSGRNGEGPKA